MMMLAVLSVTVFPYVLIVAIAKLIDRYRASRAECAARQIAVTDAIHREVGPVVAPVVEKRAWGPWRLRIAVPRDHDALVCRIVDVAQQSLDALRLQPCEIVLLRQVR